MSIMKYFLFTKNVVTEDIGIVVVSYSKNQRWLNKHSWWGEKQLASDKYLMEQFVKICEPIFLNPLCFEDLSSIEAIFISFSIFSWTAQVSRCLSYSSWDFVLTKTHHNAHFQHGGTFQCCTVLKRQIKYEPNRCPILILLRLDADWAAARVRRCHEHGAVITPTKIELTEQPLYNGFFDETRL